MDKKLVESKSKFKLKNLLLSNHRINPKANLKQKNAQIKNVESQNLVDWKSLINQKTDSNRKIVSKKWIKL